jgi:HEAT repeat protein
MATVLAIRSLAATDAQCSGILQRALEAKNPETRKQAVMALSLAAGRGPLFGQLEEMLQGKDAEVRQAVVASLADVKSESATLRDALSDKDSSVRAAAVHSISLRNDPTLGKELEPLLQDDNGNVRLRAAAGYVRLSAIEAGARMKRRSAAVSSRGAHEQKK